MGLEQDVFHGNKFILESKELILKKCMAESTLPVSSRTPFKHHLEIAPLLPAPSKPRLFNFTLVSLKPTTHNSRSTVTTASFLVLVRRTLVPVLLTRKGTVLPTSTEPKMTPRECCGTYPERFPYETFGNANACCGGSVYTVATHKCCNGDDITRNGVNCPST